MFYSIRYQTGELEEVVNEMKKGNIPCMDVSDYDELEWVLRQLEAKGVYRVPDIPYDRTARDAVKEPEFEFRATFSQMPAMSNELSKEELMYIDFYFEPFADKSYDPVGEI